MSTDLCPGCLSLYVVRFRQVMCANRLVARLLESVCCTFPSGDACQPTCASGCLSLYVVHFRQVMCANRLVTRLLVSVCCSFLSGDVCQPTCGQVA